LKTRAPIWTLAVIGTAILVQLIPDAAALLLQERNAVQAGQWWRLFTGNFVHHSGGHLFWNSFMIGVAGCLLESRHRAAMPACLFFAATLVGPGLHLCLENMDSYAGLSGIATALVTCLVLLNLSNGLQWQLALGLLTLKLTADFLLPGSLFVSFPEPEVRSVPLAHLLGAVAGIAAVVARADANRSDA